MAIRSKIFGGPSSAAAIPTFTDAFTGNGQLTQRSPWQLWCTTAQFRNAANFPTSQYQALNSGLSTGGGVLFIETAGAAGVNFAVFTWIVPGASFWGADFGASPGHSQFSQYKIVSDNSAGLGNSCRGGLGVMCQQCSPNFNNGGGYYLEVRGDTFELQLYRGIDGGPNGIAPNGGSCISLAGPVGGAFALGDTIRLECTVAAGDNTLTVLVNGAPVVGLTAIVDNAAVRPRFGIPGIGFMSQNSNAFFQTVDDYTGGPL